MTTTAAVLDALDRAPAIVVPLVREVRPDVLKRRPSPGRWSAHEHACHLAHVHGLFFERLDAMLASPSAVITPYQPGQSDADDFLLRMPLDDALQRFADDRRRLVARLRALTPEQWATVGWQGREALGDMAHAYLYAQRTADGRIALGGRGVPYRFGSRTDNDGRTQRWR